MRGVKGRVQTHSDNMLARRVLRKTPSWGECTVALAEGTSLVQL